MIHNCLNNTFSGNICRSPIAEAVFVNLLETRGHSDDWEVDSAAIGRLALRKKS